jgi:hypothetical protein
MLPERLQQECCAIENHTKSKKHKEKVQAIRKEITKRGQQEGSRGLDARNRLTKNSLHPYIHN